MEPQAVHELARLLATMCRNLHVLDKAMAAQLEASANGASSGESLKKLATQMEQARSETQTALLLLERHLRMTSDVPSEIRDWAKQQFSEEEIAAGIQDIRRTGGVELAEFIHELEKAAYHG